MRVLNDDPARPVLANRIRQVIGIRIVSEPHAAVAHELPQQECLADAGLTHQQPIP